MAWLLAFIAAGGLLLWRWRGRRTERLVEPTPQPQLSDGETEGGPDPAQTRESLVRIALTDRRDLEADRLEAVRTLGRMADVQSRAALLALSHPGATFSNARLRKAARQALQSIDEQARPRQGQLSLAATAGQQGGLSSPPEPDES